MEVMLEEKRGSSHSEFSATAMLGDVFSLVAAVRFICMSDLFDGSYAMRENYYFNVHVPETHGRK